MLIPEKQTILYMRTTAAKYAHIKTITTIINSNKNNPQKNL